MFGIKVMGDNVRKDAITQNAKILETGTKLTSE